jgi:hypothetical protein
VIFVKAALDPTKSGHEGPAGWECEHIEYIPSITYRYHSAAVLSTRCS